MKPMVFTFAAFVFVVPGALAQDRRTEESGDGFIVRLTSLVPPSVKRELQLNKEQTMQLQILEEEFKQKRMATVFKTAVSIAGIVDSKKGAKDQEPAPVLAIAHEVTGGLLELRRTRVRYEQQVAKFLDEKQKRIYEEVRERPRDRRVRDAHEDGFESLDLSAEQRKQVEMIRQEYVQRLREVLTPEQRQRLDRPVLGPSQRLINGSGEPAKK